jgi:hypothetical protein
LAGATGALASDSFQRTVTAGWGSADSGGAWTILDSPTNWSVKPGTGSITAAPSAQDRAVLSNVVVQDVDLLGQMTLPRCNGTGANCDAYVVGRYVGGSSPTYYRVGAIQGQGQATVMLRAQRDDGTMLSSDINTGIPAADGIALFVRAEFQGVNPTTIRARVWASGTAEPTTWLLNLTDSSSAQQVAGAIGVRVRNEDTSAPHTFGYQSYLASPLSTSPSPTPTNPPTQTRVATMTASPTGSPVATSTLSPVPSSNTIEDNFSRPNQSGWGISTNADGIAPVTWGMDSSASSSYVTIANTSGIYGYPGAINVPGIASAGNTIYNGGDALVKLAVSTVGHVTPYVVENACADKSCYYGARLHTSQHLLELARRSGNVTNILASTSFSPTANTGYWLRLDVTPGTSTVLRAKVWAEGTTEPASWTVTTTDTQPLAANLTGTGGSWDVVGSGETIQYTCYAFATNGLAAPCAAPSGATTTPTLTPAPSKTATSTSIPTNPPATATKTPTPKPSSSPTPTSTGGPDNAHLIRSVNDSLFDASDQLMNDATTQSIVKQHGTPLIRMPLRDQLTDAQNLQALGAIKNAGAAPLVIAHGACISDPYTPDNHFLSLVAQVFTTGPVYVEYGNEEDLSCNGSAGVSATTYQASWNVVVPQLKANYPTFKFIGPVNFQQNPTYIATFVTGANPQPDFISWHEYVCSSSDSDSTCNSHIANWATHVANTNAAVQGAIGHTIPIMITEWNLDPNTDSRYSNASFIQPWTTSALAEWSSLASQGVYAAFLYTLESHTDFQLIDSSDNFTPQGAVFFL